MNLNVAVIIASTREARLGDKVGRWVHAQAAQRAGWSVELVDLLAWPLPNYSAPTPAKLAEQSYADERLRGWVQLVSKFDVFIIVTPEYNHGYPGALKNALDHVYAGWNRKAVAFVSYGGTSGGVRAVQQLRQVVVELQLAPLRDEVNIPFIGRALDEAGVPRDELHAKRLSALLNELQWWGTTLKAGRERAS